MGTTWGTAWRAETPIASPSNVIAIVVCQGWAPWQGLSLITPIIGASVVDAWIKFEGEDTCLIGGWSGNCHARWWWRRRWRRWRRWWWRRSISGFRSATPRRTRRFKATSSQCLNKGQHVKVNKGDKMYLNADNFKVLHLGWRTPEDVLSPLFNVENSVCIEHLVNTNCAKR